MFIEVAPASMLFSINSLSAAEGDTTTSPAAILLIHCSESLLMDGAGLDGYNS